MERHLGTAHELIWFAMNMAEQLEIHQKEKKPLREVDYGKVRSLVIDEINRRIAIISDITTSLDDINKQCVHIANYSMMLFLRGKYNV